MSLRKLIFNRNSLLLRAANQHINKHQFCTASNPGTKTYEGDGKTSVNILNNDMENGLLINSISQAGFRLNNDIFIIGPMIILPRSVLSWNIENFNHINENSLSIFKVIEPKMDLIVIGIGDQKPTAEFQRKILAFMRKYNVNKEEWSPVL
ncbi:hypothetical protein PVAND_009850 [Polypedilum vanderplanki]|uniref:NADH dehydrogenase [ubiquinone] 1 alpha subcomplex assembly factor 3 n=1 Tax=Polypedilum vanderplanki TaxID=319348 RepID=A0A9J6CEY5_POLVA|nr:hypothetical protein PVAND_009850 [Polypedilum vanderplanki]